MERLRGVKTRQLERMFSSPEVVQHFFGKNQMRQIYL